MVPGFAALHDVESVQVAAISQPLAVQICPVGQALVELHAWQTNAVDEQI